MSRDLNKVMIIGRLGRDPEMRYTNSGRPVTTFSVATTRTWKTAKGEKRSETEWFNVVAWGSLAEICSRFLEKGQRVYIEGRLQTRRWEDAAGESKKATEIVAHEMIMLTRKSNRSSEEDVNAFEDDPGYSDLEESEYPF